MTPLAPLVTRFFRSHLVSERAVSKHTITSYSYAIKFLCQYASGKVGRSPSQLFLEDFDARMVLDYLEHAEQARGNSARTRNLRLTAIRSFMRYVEHEVPSALEQVRRILAISAKRVEQRLVSHLTREEMEAILQGPDPGTRAGVRDQALLYLGFACGLRVSELVGLRLEDLELDGPYPSIIVRGKGRKQRRLPLWKEACRALSAWLAARGRTPLAEVFLSARGEALTCSGFSFILAGHVEAARKRCATLATKRVSPHVLRHTCAVNTLQATRDIRKVALWLGHTSLRSTEVYLRADPTEKLATLEAALPPNLRRGVFQVEDRLIAWLSGGKLCGVDPWPETHTQQQQATSSA